MCSGNCFAGAHYGSIVAMGQFALAMPELSHVFSLETTVPHAFLRSAISLKIGDSIGKTSVIPLSSAHSLYLLSGDICFLHPLVSFSITRVSHQTWIFRLGSLHYYSDFESIVALLSGFVSPFLFAELGETAASH